MGDTPDDVCERFSAQAPGISIRLLGGDLVLVEGSVVGFQFLAELFGSMARREGDGFQIGPQMAGSALFASSSQLGLYLRTDPPDANGNRLNSGGD